METMTMNEEQEVPYEVDEVVSKKDYTTDFNYKHEYAPAHIVIHIVLQLGWLIGLYLITFRVMWATFAWTFFIGFWISQSIALGAHRYYTHKSFKASLPLQVAFILLHTMAGQNSMYTWVRDHKLHHKYSDTDADPHNATRGFFYSHMGWLLVKRHPLVLKKQREIDITDLRGDKLIMFQFKYFLPIYILAGFAFPVGVPIYFWNETFWNAFFTAYFFQYVSNLHITWAINSVAHIWGNRPYDKRIKAVQSKISWILSMGEGWHNYHHTFPWDCRLSEYGQLNGASTVLLYSLAYLGLAYDLKTASPGIVHGHMKRHGDKMSGKMVDQTANLTGRSDENSPRENTRVM